MVVCCVTIPLIYALIFGTNSVEVVTAWSNPIENDLVLMKSKIMLI